MKKKISSTLILATFCGLICVSIFAQKKDEITLVDGRVLKKPYVISKTPAGLNIGHESGVIFIPFHQMSKERQKQYNYNPEEAKKYREKMAAARRSRQLRMAKSQTPKSTDETFVSYGAVDFPEQSALGKLQSELSELIQEKARLEKERSSVNSERVAPASGPSSDIYISYRGGKVYRNKRTNYAKMKKSNAMNKRKRLKEIAAALQRNARRTTTVRNLIYREKTKVKGY